MNELKINGVETMIGTENVSDVTLTLAFKDGVSDKVQTAVSAQAMEIVSAYNNITRGYFQLLSPLARFIKAKGYQQIKDCKSPSQFLINLLGCSKGTASELSRVATKFYGSDGQPSKWCCHFTYSELTKLLEYDDNDIQEIMDRLGDGKHTRQELLNTLTEYNADKELAKQGIDTDNSTVEPGTVDGNISASDDSANDDASDNKTDTDENGTADVETDIRWTEAEKVEKLITELASCSKGKKTKTEMQEIAFRALNTIKEYQSLMSNPFENE